MCCVSAQGCNRCASRADGCMSNAKAAPPTRSLCCASPTSEAIAERNTKLNIAFIITMYKGHFFSSGDVLIDTTNAFTISPHHCLGYLLSTPLSPAALPPRLYDTTCCHAAPKTLPPVRAFPTFSEYCCTVSPTVSFDTRSSVLPT
jgi:hypothetical protein